MSVIPAVIIYLPDKKAPLISEAFWIKDLKTVAYHGELVPTPVHVGVVGVSGGVHV
ncbi:hypothetical protein TUM12151_21050 [Morganella morganii]|nr:hypothetical protein TUM12149_23720 [Morganella morganii]GIZ31283.1 hypothetical protein TUM12150_17690 [Morganella morganii]GIZ35119.1 hypothetical protein TUM12151_21050 [Morganella morganii]